MRNLSYVISVIGIALVFISANGMDSDGVGLIICCCGLALGMLLAFVGYQIGKGYAEDEENDF